MGRLESLYSVGSAVPFIATAMGEQPEGPPVALRSLQPPPEPPTQTPACFAPKGPESH